MTFKKSNSAVEGGEQRSAKGRLVENNVSGDGNCWKRDKGSDILCDERSSPGRHIGQTEGTAYGERWQTGKGNICNQIRGGDHRRVQC